MTRYHSDNYIGFLREATPKSLTPFQCNSFCIGEDCPLFPGVYDFCQLSAGGSICGAQKLNSGAYDVAVNWAGGLHHARRGEASGFCYVNDIVLGILELLKVHERVLYVDIDIHHGDGVEEAFYGTPRVMTLSFHKYGNYFPYSGAIDDIGVGPGKYHAVNFPLQDGITDAAYETIFKPVVQSIMDRYKPGAVVLQCGADSLSGDRLGTFNMTLGGHGACAEFIRSFNLPTLVVGGGGYTVRNVARCWCNETAIMLGEKLPDDLPYTEYLEYFTPDFHLQIQPTPGVVDFNTPEYLNTMRARILDNLRYAEGTPQISMNPQGHGEGKDDEDVDLEAEENPEIRMSQKQRDRRVARDDEFCDDDAGEGDRGVPHRKKAKTIVVSEHYPYKISEPENTEPKEEATTTTTATTAATATATAVETNTEKDTTPSAAGVTAEIPTVTSKEDDAPKTTTVENDSAKKPAEEHSSNEAQVTPQTTTITDEPLPQPPSTTVPTVPTVAPIVPIVPMVTPVTTLETTTTTTTAVGIPEVKIDNESKVENSGAGANIVGVSVGEGEDDDDMIVEIDTASGSVGLPIEEELGSGSIQDETIPQEITSLIDREGSGAPVRLPMSVPTTIPVLAAAPAPLVPAAAEVIKMEINLPEKKEGAEGTEGKTEEEKSCRKNEESAGKVESETVQQQEELKKEETGNEGKGNAELEPGEIPTPPEQN